jgi:hypothetical protein
MAPGGIVDDVFVVVVVVDDVGAGASANSAVDVVGAFGGTRGTTGRLTVVGR